MFKICVDCEKEYETNQPKRQLCPDCKNKHIEEARKQVRSVYRVKNSLPKPKTKKHKPKLTFSDILRIQEEYHRQNGEWISYGKAVELIEKGEIKCV